jgi:hypothetical protein
MRRRAVAALVVALAAAVVLPVAWARATAGQPPPPGLPTLPPVEDQVEGLYDADGCLRTGLDEVDCSVRADELDAALARGPATETRHLEGFVGSRWLGHPQGDGPEVLDQTVTLVPADGGWGAVGLARNEGTTELAGIDVTARLLDSSGEELSVATATSPVAPVRPGEPVPFTLASDVPADAVASVEWSAEASTTAVASRRDLGWTAWWERPAGGERVELYFYADPPGTTPHLLFGTVENLGSEPVASPQVVVAWLDPDGRVVATTGAPVLAPDGSPADALDAGASGDALLQPAGPVPSGAEALVWVVGG